MAYLDLDLTNVQLPEDGDYRVDSNTMAFTYKGHPVVVQRRLDGWTPRVSLSVNGYTFTDMRVEVEALDTVREEWHNLDTHLFRLTEATHKARAAQVRKIFGLD